MKRDNDYIFWWMVDNLFFIPKSFRYEMLQQLAGDRLKK